MSCVLCVHRGTPQVVDSCPNLGSGTWLPFTKTHPGLFDDITTSDDDDYDDDVSS
jgi:hypothetical protein